MGAELFDEVVDDGGGGLGDFGGADGGGAGVPVEADAGHTDAAEFHHDVGAGGDRGDAVAPLGHNFGVVVGVEADAAEAAEVVQHDGELGGGVGEIGEVGELGEV